MLKRKPSDASDPAWRGVTLAIWRRQGKTRRIKALTLSARRPVPFPGAGTFPLDTLLRDSYCAATHASRNSFFITLPLAFRGSGCAVRSIVSGTL
jgi:hypothetical protein